MQGSYTWSKNLDEVENGEGGGDVFELQLPTNNQARYKELILWTGE